MRGQGGSQRPSNGVTKQHGIATNTKNAGESATVPQATRNGEPLPLTDEEKSELARCEQIFANRTRPFYEWGQALSTIRRHRLFRGVQKTFQEYCQVRWQISPSYSCRLMKGAEVIESLLPIGNTALPTSEAQVRPLTQVNRQLVSRIWRDALKSAGETVVTAAQVHQSVIKYVSPANRHDATSRQEEVVALSQQSGCPALPALRKALLRLKNQGAPRPLTYRQRRILELVAEGMTNKDIARKLSCSKSTVRTHFEQIFERLRVHTRSHAIAIFFKDYHRHE